MQHPYPEHGRFTAVIIMKRPGSREFGKAEWSQPKGCSYDPLLSFQLILI